MMAGKCSNTMVIIAALVLAAGIGTGGWFVSYGLIHHGSYNDFVTVKGLATQDVEADLALWPIRHTATGDVLPDVQAELEANSKKIKEFLVSQGIDLKDLIGQKVRVTDMLSETYRSENADTMRYIVSETLTVRSSDVAAIEKATMNAGDMLKQGIAVSKDMDSSSGNNLEYIFTKLNDIKPAMIAAATRNARESAEQFAKDTGAEVGKIKEASQGVFQILPRDSEDKYVERERQERFKTVRIVSTFKYYLK